VREGAQLPHPGYRPVARVVQRVPIRFEASQLLLLHDEMVPELAAEPRKARMFS
jgi:hypothetical protein